MRTIIVEKAGRFARDLMVQEVGHAKLRKRGIDLIAADIQARSLTPRQLPSWCARRSARSPSSTRPYVAKLRGARAPGNRQVRRTQEPRRAQSRTQEPRRAGNPRLSERERPPLRGSVRQIDAELTAFSELPPTFSRENTPGMWSGATIARLRGTLSRIFWDLKFGFRGGACVVVYGERMHLVCLNFCRLRPYWRACSFEDRLCGC